MELMRTTAANRGNLSSQRYWTNISCRIWIPSRFHSPSQSSSRVCRRLLYLSRFCKTENFCDLWQTYWPAFRFCFYQGRHSCYLSMSIARHWGCSSKFLPFPVGSSFRGWCYRNIYLVDWLVPGIPNVFAPVSLQGLANWIELLFLEEDFVEYLNAW